MLTDLVHIIKDVALRHKGVRTFIYQAKSYNNAQNDHATFQFYLDDVSYHALNITTNIFRVEFNAYILSQPKNRDVPDDILDTQNTAYTIAANILAYIDNYPGYANVISLHDYDIVTISHYSDDDSAGVKLSIVLSTPSPVSLCDLGDNFNEEPYAPEPDKDIDVTVEETPDELVIKPIKLPRNGC